MNKLEIAWLLTFLASASFKHRTAAESLAATIDTTHFIRFTFDGLALILVLTSLSRIPRLKFDPISIFLFYIIVGVVSTFWSESPVATLGKSGEVLIGTFIVWKTLSLQDSRERLRRLLEIFIVYNAVILTYALAGFILFPEGFSTPSHGLFPRQITLDIMHSNSIASIGSLLALLYAARYLSRNTYNNKHNRYILYYFYFALFPILAQGRTGMTILVVGTFFLFLRARPVSTFLFGPILVGGMVYLIWPTLKALFLRGQSIQLVMGLSGRTVMWERAWQAFQDTPYFGKGFAVGSRVMFQEHLGGFGDTISHIHNGFLEVLLGVGVVGFVIWIVAVLYGMWLAVAAFNRNQHLDVTIGFLFVAATTIMSSGAGGWWSPPLIYFLVGTGYLVAQKRYERTHKRNAKM